MSTQELAHLRQDYQVADLLESEVSPDPLEQFRRWFEQARGVVREPNAMTLATVDSEGRPHARVVLLKGLEESGFQFYTNIESDKGQQIAQRPHVALVFLWDALERQVRIEGVAERLSDSVADEYFAVRPRASQAGAWASQQSRVLQSREQLEAQMAAVVARYEGQDIPRPEAWGGYVVRPERIEFWQGRRSRLHDRLVYEAGAGSWSMVRLSP